jgi:hypothetical protein
MFIPDLDLVFFTYHGSRIQGSKRHRIPDLDSQHCIILSIVDGILKFLRKKNTQVLLVYIDPDPVK